MCTYLTTHIANYGNYVAALNLLNIANIVIHIKGILFIISIKFYNPDLQNAKAVVSGVSPLVMRQVHVPLYRRFVFMEIMRKGRDNISDNQRVCDLPFCQQPQTTDTSDSRMPNQEFVNCERCHRWCHVVCARVKKNKRPFVCVICN